MATKTTRFGRGNIDPQRWDRLKTILGEALEQNSSAGRIAVVEQRFGSLEATAERLTTFKHDSVDLEGKRVGVVLSGGNVDLAYALELFRRVPEE